MEKYTITKEQILQLHESNSPETRIQIAKMFPEVLKKELEVGKWYRNKDNALANYQGGRNGYGFIIQGDWVFLEDIWTFDYPENWKEATDEEVEEALIAEAKKRGFIDGVEHNITNGSANLIARGSRFYFDKYWNKLLFNNWSIFENGKWAEIIPEESKVISIEKAEKILSKKYGQKVEIK